MANSKLVQANKKVEEKVVSTYKNIESGVVNTYKKIENKFVDRYLTHDGETIEDAKLRLKREQEKHKN